MCMLRSVTPFPQCAGTALPAHLQFRALHSRNCQQLRHQGPLTQHKLQRLHLHSRHGASWCVLHAHRVRGRGGITTAHAPGGQAPVQVRIQLPAGRRRLIAPAHSLRWVC
jgi:hypothetical protein